MSTLIDEAGVRVALGGGALFVAVAAMSALSVPHGYAVAVLLVLSGALCLVLPFAHAVLLAVAGWALTDGFEVHRFGQLAFDRTAVLLLVGFTFTLVVSRPLRSGSR